MHSKLYNRLMIILLVFALVSSLSLVAVKDSRQRNRAARAQQSPLTSLPLVFRQAGSSTLADTRLVNVPYFIDTISFSAMSVFWFGQVSSTENYADVRAGYNNTGLMIDVNIMDRHLWYDYEPSLADLTNWDAVTLFISLVPNPGNKPGVTEYRWVAQMNHWQPRENYQAVYRGNGSGWDLVAVPFTTETVWRGEGLNTNERDDKGWWVTFRIPFSALGYTNPPHDVAWRFGVALHDRNTPDGPMAEDKIWPEEMDALNPGTWGSLHFGLPVYQPSTTDYDGTTVIRNGVRGAIVPDAHVGGAFTCGDGIDHWDQWGNMNYEATDPGRFNIQNQRDISDYPCFSKYFITFPLDLIPDGVEVISATLTMYHFGNSDPSRAQPSAIHVLTIRDSWDPATITWNSAPLAWMNTGKTWVDPLLAYPGWPGVSRTWDVSLAVHEALRLGEPLRLALYSTDYEMHSGKYFFSSDSNSDGSARPYLTVWWRDP